MRWAKACIVSILLDGVEITEAQAICRIAYKLKKELLHRSLTRIEELHQAFWQIFLQICVISLDNVQCTFSLTILYIFKIRYALILTVASHNWPDGSYDIVVTCLHMSELGQGYLYYCHLHWIVCIFGIIWVEVKCHLTCLQED